MMNTSRSSFEATEICLKLSHYLVVHALAFLGFGFLITNCYIAYLVDKTHAKIKRLEGKLDYLVKSAKVRSDCED